METAASQLAAVVMTTVGIVTILGGAATALVRISGRITTLEEKVVALRRDLHAEEERGDRVAGMAGDLDTRLARIEAKLDLLVQQKGGISQ